jgi:hypothetical protein
MVSWVNTQSPGDRLIYAKADSSGQNVIAISTSSNLFTSNTYGYTWIGAGVIANSAICNHNFTFSPLLAVLGRLEATKCTFGALIVITDGSVYTSQPMMIAIVLL